MRHVLGILTVWVMALAFAPAGAPSAAEIRVAGGDEPPLLASIASGAGIQAVAIAPQGTRVAVAERDDEREGQSRITIRSAAGDQTVSVSGLVRALLFDPPGTTLYVIRFRPAKRRLGDAELLRIESDEGRPRSVMRLPSSATALDYWARQGSLLVAGANEIRTVILDGLRSGPLFRVLGPNSAIASLASSDLVLVGQQADLLLLDLGDPHGDESMPVRARVAAPAPISALAAPPDGTSALCRLQDGRVLRVSFDPLALVPDGSADAIVAAGKAAATDPVRVPPLVAASSAPTAEPELTGAEQAPSPTPEGPAEPPEAQAAGSATAQNAPSSAGDEVADVETTAAAARSSDAAVPAEDTPTQTPPGPPSKSAPQLSGRIEGAARDMVVEVVLLGPDNLLREARRVRPDPDGTWRVDGLAPGRYQIQLAGGPQRIVVSEPAAVMAVVVAGESVEAQTFQVLRAYEP